MALIIADDENGPKWVANELYGRKEELRLLNGIAEEKTSSVVLVEGGEGAGKTALIHQGDWKENGWVFVSRKFDKSLTAEPYSALEGALDQLVEIWAGNDKASSASQMESLLQALHEDIDLLVNVIPGIFRTLEILPDGLSSSRRKSIEKLATSGGGKVRRDSGAIAIAFLKLISFLSSTNPVLLFLEDAHYADAASMETLRVIAETAVTDSTKYGNQLLLAMSYRKELLEKNKFAFKAIRNIEEFGGNVHKLAVQDLDIDTVNEMVASLVHSDREESLHMSRIIHKKTGGNPFAVFQFLRTAREKGFFTFSGETFKWEWGDVEMLDQYASVSDNVATVLASSMDNLSLETKNLLKVSSCLGKVIPIHVLVEYFKDFYSCEGIVGVEEHELLEPLLEGALKEGILVKSVSLGAYMWSNDRLQQATYDLIPVEMRAELHKKLGMLLWRLGLMEDEEWMIFMAADQINKYSENRHDVSLGNEVAELNLQAAKLALNKGAIYPALELLVNAEKHVVIAGRWTERYGFTLDLLTTLAETQMSVGETERAIKTANLVVDNAKTLNDKFRAYVLLLEGQVSGKDRSYDKGVEMALELLKLYGEKHPKSSLFPGQKLVKLAKLKKMLPGGELDGLLELPDMTNKTALQIQLLLVEHLNHYSLYSTKYKTLNWFACVRALKNACKHGISPELPMAVVHMALNMRREGHYKEASEYADFALLLLERIPLKLGSNNGYVRVVASAGVLSAVRSFNRCLNEVLKARAELLRAGKAKESIETVSSYATIYLCVGLPLNALETDLAAHFEDAKNCGSTYTVQQLLMIQRQTIWNLKNYSNNPTVLSGCLMDREAELQKVEGNARKMTKRDCDTHSLLLACVYSDWEAAETLIEALWEYSDADDAMLVRTHFRRCYLGLAGLALSRKAKTAKARKKYLTLGKKMLKYFTKDIKCGSVNAYPIVAMLQAEKSRSKLFYDNAIRACARLGLVHHEAYMCERAAEFFQEQNDDEFSEFYAAQAISLHREWGAMGKADQLIENYSHVLQESSLCQSSVNRSLQGRPRYSTTELEALRRIDWEDFSMSIELEDSEEGSLLLLEPAAVEPAMQFSVSN